MREKLSLGDVTAEDKGRAGGGKGMAGSCERLLVLLVLPLKWCAKLRTTSRRRLERAGRKRWSYGLERGNSVVIQHGPNRVTLRRCCVTRQRSRTADRVERS